MARPVILMTVHPPRTLSAASSIVETLSGAESAAPIEGGAADGIGLQVAILRWETVQDM